MIAIVDYGVGNLFSLISSFAAIGADARVTANEKEILAADRLILPGVGAFGDAADKLEQTGLKYAVLAFAQTQRPLLGICLGMQLLFTRGLEYGEHKGLNFIQGDVAPLSGMIPKELKIPQIGWNRLHIEQTHPILARTREGDFAYFVHSYHAVNCAEYVCATTEYGTRVTAVAAKDNVMGCQFHPEKSGAAGLRLLRAFAEM